MFRPIRILTFVVSLSVGMSGAVHGDDLADSAVLHRQDAFLNTGEMVVDWPWAFSSRIRKAWQSAGAVPGRMSSELYSRLEFHPYQIEGTGNDWPAFRLSHWNADAFANLPAPDHPFAIEINSDDFVDKDIKHLLKLTRLQAIKFNGAWVTGECLRELANLREIKAITGIRQLNNSNLAPIKEFLSLEVLDLWGMRITDEGLDCLKDLRKLRSLSLFGTDVTAQGLKTLRQSNMKSIDLSYTHIGDEGIVELKWSAPRKLVQGIW